jgi:RNA polymerase sigma factor (sigma-70 family)
MATKRAPAPRPSGFWRAWKAETDDRKRDRLLGAFITGHEGLAHLIVGRMLHDGAARGCDRDDLMQAARLGLVIAANGWDPTRGRFTTYAWWRVRKEVQRAIDHDMPLRGRPGKPRPQRMPMRRSIPAPGIPDDRTADQRRLELATALLENMTDAERKLLFRPGLAEGEARESLLMELWECFDEFTPGHDPSPAGGPKVWRR